MADNLIGNGLRFAKRQVIVCVLEEESGLTLEVKDDGTGFDISEERAKQAFTTSGLRDDMKHFGLGMYISELYCKKHDGFLTVENQSGGAWCAVLFPVDCTGICCAGNEAFLKESFLLCFGCESNDTIILSRKERRDKMKG